MRSCSFFFALALSAISSHALAQACVITSSDKELPIRMCQQNISIPETLFTSSFCQPQIPDRSFNIDFVRNCPSGAYGICRGAKAEGIAYEQSIHYYSDAADAPVLAAYCEKISKGTWLEPEAE
ncbi:NADH:ubiquinone oxidoreductase [Halopseudomonas sp.]|uniref:NADH:ubiquinone oxidoreductase n=1 Tax=Halopseudomonas sp. TaxID=2901191 RepID=UPI003567D243